MTLVAEEFIRRFLLHVLPEGFQRIRSALGSSVCLPRQGIDAEDPVLGRAQRLSSTLPH